VADPIYANPASEFVKLRQLKKMKKKKKKNINARFKWRRSPSQSVRQAP
jgi:hypothetical protein